MPKLSHYPGPIIAYKINRLCLRPPIQERVSLGLCGKGDGGLEGVP